jgi:hypothetical protein
MTEQALLYAKTENIGYRTPDILFMLAAILLPSSTTHSNRTPTPRETE